MYWLYNIYIYKLYIYIYISRLIVMSCEAKEEVPCNSLLMNMSILLEKNLVEIKNASTYEP